MTLALRYSIRSDVGLLREGNEDSAYAGPHLLAIADGMGGHAAGEVASAVAISALAPLDQEMAAGGVRAERGGRPYRRLPRLPAQRRQAGPDHPRSHAGPVAGRRGPADAGGSCRPSAALPGDAGAAEQHRR